MELDGAAVSSDSLRDDVATACQILAAQGHEHLSLGHVSARRPDTGLVAVKPAGLGLAEVRPEDVVITDLDGQKVTDDNRALHAEMPIHTRIYRRRADVNAVVHTHPLHVAALAASSATMLMVNQDSIHFLDRIATYPDPQLIRTSEHGDALAAALADTRAVILKNHGLVTVGHSIPEATFLAVALLNSLRVQALAAQYGQIHVIDPIDAAAMAQDFAAGYAAMVESSWQYMKRCLP